MGTERDSMRVRKGDMKVDVKGLKGRVTVYLDRDRVRPERKALLAARVEYLGMLAVTLTTSSEWPPANAVDALAAFVAAAAPERSND